MLGLVKRKVATPLDQLRVGSVQSHTRALRGFANDTESAGT
jgi:hypothetical protein